MHVVADSLFEGLGVHAGNGAHLRAAAPFHHRHDRLLWRRSATRVVALVTRLATDIGLIDFNVSAPWTKQLGAGISHCETDAVQHEERGLVGNSGLTVNLQRAHAFLRRRGAPEGEAPPAQLDLRIFEHCSSTDGELRFAADALAVPTKPAVIG